MEPKIKMLQELCALVLAGAHSPEQLGAMAEMIRGACDYRWVGLYKIKRSDFVIVARTGQDPPTYPRFPITQGLAGAAIESRQTIIVEDVHKDPRYLPTFGTTRSEIVVPIITEGGKVIGLIDVESERLNAFDGKDREILERAALILSRALK
jgi:L-methionine (R)-S-oxide reductase